MVQGGEVNMKLKLKKSKITDWWVAKKGYKMAFENIISGDPLEKELLIVGYLDKSKEVLATSTNQVILVCKDGVVTAQGSFYPFEEAHELYLQFLINANKENTVIARAWEIKQEFPKIMLVADIICGSEIKKNIIFDFIPDGKNYVMFHGYSETLSSNVVLTTFARRNVCIILEIPKMVTDDIYSSSFALEEESYCRLQAVRKLFEQHVKGSYILVK